MDPLEEQSRQEKEDEPIEDDRVLTWIVQFAAPLNRETIRDLRSDFSLKLTEYIPPRCYVEALRANAARQLRDDPRVRAVVRMTSEFKVASEEARQDDKSNEPTPPSPTDVVLVDSADADLVAQAIQAILPPDGVQAVIDDRGRGGVVLVRVNANLADVQRIATMDAVRWVQAVPETVDDSSTTASSSSSTTLGPNHVREAVRLGLTGKGQIVGVIDKGPPDVAHCFFVDPGHEQGGTVHRKIAAVRNSTGTGPGEHSTFTCGIAAGDDVGNPGSNRHRGIAWDARLVCGNRLDLATSSLMAELSAAAESGAFVHSNSWHSKPQGSRLPATYDQRSADVDRFTWMNEDHVVLGSSGNTGEEQGPPGTAKNAVCVSATVADGPASDPDGVGDGNRGPTADGRRKPDVTGIGCGVHVPMVATPCGISLRPRCASSYATPWTAAVVALVRQQLTEGRWRDGERRLADAFVPTGALLRSILVSSAIARGPIGIPSDVRGWGAVDTVAALGQHAPRILLDVRNDQGLTTGDELRLPFTVTAGGPLSATLVWTEPPGAIGSDTCVVNDLDLRLHRPGGDVLLGNNFPSGGMAGPATPDRLNSTEVVVVSAAEAGEWIVEVVASEVNVGNPGQGFALVVTGAVDAPKPSSAPLDTLRRTTPIAAEGESGPTPG